MHERLSQQRLLERDPLARTLEAVLAQTHCYHLNR